MTPLMPNKWPPGQRPGFHATARPAGPLAAGITAPFLVAATVVIPVLIRLSVHTQPGRGAGNARRLWATWAGWWPWPCSRG